MILRPNDGGVLKAWLRPSPVSHSLLEGPSALGCIIQPKGVVHPIDSTLIKSVFSTKDASHFPDAPLKPFCCTKRPNAAVKGVHHGGASWVYILEGHLGVMRWGYPQGILISMGIHPALSGHISLVLNSGVIRWLFIIWVKDNERIFKLQKKAIRVIFKSKYNAHTSPLFKQFRILKFPDLCALHDLKFCHRFVNKNLPEYFLSEMLQCNTSVFNINERHNDKYCLPAVSHEFAKDSTLYKFPNVYNHDNEMDDKLTF